MDWIPRVFFAAIAAVFLGRLLFRRVTVFEYENGLLYRRGSFRRLLTPGQYWLFRWTTRVEKVDVRRRFVSVPGQEVLTSDNVGLKVSLAAEFEVVDPPRAVNTVQDYEQALYLQLQIALRSIVGDVTADALLEKRQEIGSQLMTAGETTATELGLKLHQASIKDIMFPGDLKKIFTKVVKARKEGLGALEKARGENAALRHLANAAQLLENNPSLVYLRTLQALGDGSGNSVVLGGPLDMFTSLRGQNGEGKT